MILDNKNYNIENNLETESSEFEIAANAKMFDILSNKIYEDPIRAVIRELSCNAIDANIEVENIEPFKVYLPTQNYKSLIIEDNGIGMTHEDVMTVYKSYGKSTKSNSNKVIGALGLGGKTPLAYTSQFILETAKDGKKNSYIIFKDEDGIPNVTLTSSEDTDISGTKIEMIVRNEDIDLFITAAIKTFVFFDKMPIIMRGEDEFYRVIYQKFSNTMEIGKAKLAFDEARFLLKNDYISNESNGGDIIIRKILNSYNSTHGIIMGQVYYSVNPKAILRDGYGTAAEEVLNFPNYSNYSGIRKVIHVNLGDVSFQPSREVLNYNKSTIALLQNRFYNHFENYIVNMENYKDPKTFLKNFSKINYAKDVVKISTWDDTNQDVSSIRDLYKNVINYLYSEIDQKEANYYIKQRHNGTWEVQAIAQDSASKIQDLNTTKSIFSDIFVENKIKNIIVLDDANISEKLDNFHKKALEKQRFYFTTPISLRNKLVLLDKTINTLCVTEKTAKKLKAFLKIDFINCSKLVVTKEAKIKTKSERDTSAKCYNYTERRYAEINEVLKITKKNKVTYECFEGEVNKKGWWYTPLFDVINKSTKINKQACIKINYHGSYNNCSNRVEDFNTIFNMLPSNRPHHYLVDWNFFKKYIIGNKNWVHINDYATNLIKDNFNTISTNALNIILFGDSPFYRSTQAEALLKHGTEKYLNFENTAFGIECQRKINESFNKETDISLNKKTVSTFHNSLMGMKEYFSSDSFNKLLKDFEELKLKLEAVNIKRVNYCTEIYEKYPMIIYALKSDFDKDHLINYIAEKESLVLK